MTIDEKTQRALRRSGANAIDPCAGPQEAWRAIDEANRIFGADGWSRELIEMRCAATREREGLITTAYVAKVRVSLNLDTGQSFRDAQGCGEGKASTPFEAHSEGLKAAELDATLRALAGFGRPFGLLALAGANRARPASRPKSPSGRKLERSTPMEDGEAGTDPGEMASANVADADGDHTEATENDPASGPVHQAANGEQAQQPVRGGSGHPQAKGAPDPDACQQSGQRPNGGQSHRPDTGGPAHQLSNGEQAHQPVRNGSGDALANGVSAHKACQHSDPRLNSGQSHGAESGGPAHRVDPQEKREKAEAEPVGAATGKTTPPSAASTQERSTRESRLVHARDLVPDLTDGSGLMLPKQRRVRAPAHLAHVRCVPCLICGRQPCDAHHLRFMQPRAMAKKVSDEFTAPLCRRHHDLVHRDPDEPEWWAAQGVDPVEIARDLWVESGGRQSGAR